MRDYIKIGSSPCDEDCAQVGSANYDERARKECSRFIAEIRNVCGHEPEKALLTTKAFPHDFGTYYEVVCYFDDMDEDSRSYAFHVEGNSPVNWHEGLNSRKWQGISGEKVV